jgi:N-acetylglucosamine-6-phosphate deacetylase
MIEQSIYTADKIFTGEEWLYNHSIIIENETIVDVLPTSSINHSNNQQTFNTLVPAFIDIQIYGAGSKLFSVYPTTDALQNLYEYCVSSGTHFFMPTVATNTSQVFYNCIDAIRNYWQQGGKGCMGLHIEGPWINPAKRGAHIENLIHPPTIEEVKTLLDYGKDVIKIITLAPEVCAIEIIALIKSCGITISAGHSNISYSQAMQCFDENNVTAITHLYNAMSGLQHREPGLVGAAFNHPAIMASIIPDGHHVDFAAIKIAKQMMGNRLFVITDAVTQTNEGYYPHQLAGDKYESNHILSGSALTMTQAVQNLVTYCDVELEEALRMCSLYPAKMLGLDKQLGKIEKGYNAHFIEWVS